MCPKNTPISLHCEHCQAEFRVLVHRRDTARFCSLACKKQYAIDMAPKRFWANVDQSGGPDACWPWTGATSPSGYGVITVRRDGGRDAVRTNRYAIELTHGPIPDGQFACHRCDNPTCCNPAHLFIGTPADNTRDGIEKGRIVGRLNPDKVRQIRRIYATSSPSYRSLGEQFGCKAETIRDVVKHYTWKDVE